MRVNDSVYVGTAPIDAEVHRNFRRGVRRPLTAPPTVIDDDDVGRPEIHLRHAGRRDENSLRADADGHVSFRTGDQAALVQLPARGYDVLPRPGVFAARGWHDAIRSRADK